MKLDDGTYTFKVDGYGAGDRLLEGVMFDVVVSGTPHDYEVVSVTIDPEFAEYFSKFNAEMWYEKIGYSALDVLDDISTEEETDPGVWDEVLSEENPDGTLEF